MAATIGLEVSDIVRATPDHIQHRLLQIGESIGANRWEIGDIANWLMEICREFEVHGFHVTQRVVCAAVAAMCKGEISAATVERYSLIAEFYPESVRQEYHPLPWVLFETARRLGDGWRMALDFCMDYLADYGRPPARAVVEMRFMDDIAAVIQSDMDRIPVVAPMESAAAGVLVGAGAGVATAEAIQIPGAAVDTPAMPGAPLAVTLVVTAARQILRVIPDLPLDDEKRQRLATLAREIFELVK